MYGNYAVPRLRLPGMFHCVVLVTFSLLTGCAAKVEQETNGNSDGLVPVPCFKVPLLKVPLTNRPVSNNLMQDLMPEPDQVPNHSRW